MTTGVPSVFWEPPEALDTAARLARLQGCQAALLGPSTLHLFLDLLPILATPPCVIYLDSDTYPIARWGAERAAAHEAKVCSFRHQSSRDLARHLERHHPKQKAIIMCDGVSARSGNPAPLTEYLSLLPVNGWLVVDDTQALGLLGKNSCPQVPYGLGGGGTAQFHGLVDERLVLVCSLAKSFGTRLAVLSGSEKLINHFAKSSETRIHCSPPAWPEILAAHQSLSINARQGNHLRNKLAGLVRLFQAKLNARELQTESNLFPVQNLKLINVSARLLHEALRREGIQTLLRQTSRLNGQMQVSLVINTRHTPAEVDHTASVIIKIVNQLRQSSLSTTKEISNRLTSRRRVLWEP